MHEEGHILLHQSILEKNDYHRYLKKKKLQEGSKVKTIESIKTNITPEKN